jgi:cytochrome c oxidase subunit 2
MIERLIQPASTFAGDIDQLFFGVHAVIGFWFLLVQGMFFYLMYRYRYQEGVRTTYVTGKEKHLKKWVNIPHLLIILCDVFVIYFAISVWYNVKQNLPDADATIRVVSQQWAWSFVHPGADGELGTDDDIKTVDELHVQEGQVYHFQLESRDVLHNFSVPVFRLKQDAVPGRVITGWFEPTEAGVFDIQCAEMCGIGHGIMGARIHVESAADHAAWIASKMGT